jgi:uncharacterized protein YjiK/uncharacterized membrane protein YkoI
MLACAVGISACDSIWTRTDLPDAVKVRFTETYPTAAKIDWDVEQDNYEAEFEVSGRERTALFSAEGTLLRYTEEIEEQYLPDAALEEIRANFEQYKLDEVHRVQENKNTFYEVELEQNDQDRVLLFDSNGRLLPQPSVATQAPRMEQAALVNTASPTASPEGSPMVAEASWELPSELREVSGIAYLQNGKLACVQDEEGVIYIYNLKKKTVERSIDFAGSGDYEGIAVVGNTAFVLRSDGAIYEVPDFLKGKPNAILHPSVLAATQDTEGLAYDEKNNRLLIACKGYDKSLGNNKGIYAFPLDTKKMQATPVITIPLAQAQLKIAGKKPKNNYDVLQPSSLEINAGTGEIYMLDAKNLRLLTINQQGRVQKAISLDKKLLRQPEALTFGGNGEVYIASEGSNKISSVVLKYPGSI